MFLFSGFGGVPKGSSSNEVVPGIELYIDGETLSDCAQNTWYSPSSAVLTGELQNDFSYADGTISYTGEDDIVVMMLSSLSVTAAGGLAVDLDLANALNSTIETFNIISDTSTLGGYTIISVPTIHTLSTSDTLDFDIRQTSETGDTDITLVNGKFLVLKISGVES